MSAFNQDLQLYSAKFNSDEFTAENHLHKALLTHSEWLSPATTFLYGSGSSEYSAYNFPMLYITEGLRNIAKTKSIGTADLSYKWPVLGKPKKSDAISRNPYSATDKPGVGYGEFNMYFKDRWFFKGQICYTPSGLECRVQHDPKKKGNEVEYVFVIITGNPNAFVPAKDLAVGTQWGQGLRKVSKSRSRGGESRGYTPYELTNQLSVVRDTYNIAGNIANKVMVFNIKVDGQEIRLWTQWDMYRSDLKLREALEQDLWYSTYNLDADGVINQIDEDSGEVVPSGAGLLQQIDNVDTYVEMTTKKIETIISDLVYNASGAQNVSIDLFTGTGGLNAASKAMENKIAGFTFVDTSGFSKPDANGKRAFYGFYFDRYQTREGHTVRFRYHPGFDHGVKADISPKHPLEGYPMESYNMYAIDTSTYDGEPNVQYVSEKGRETIEKIVPGMSPMPFIGKETNIASTDIDASSIERMKTQGIVIKRPTNCLKIFNTILG